MTSTASLHSLLGSSLSSPEVQRALASLGRADVDEMDGYTFHEFPKAGISWEFDENLTLSTLHFFSRGRDGYAQFQGALPLGLRFDMRQDDVIARVGPPTESGGPSHDPLVGDVAPFVSYRQDNAIIHVEFNVRTGRISLVTAMRPDRLD